MPNIKSQGNPLIQLDTELERTLINNLRMMNERAHDQGSLLENS